MANCNGCLHNRVCRYWAKAVNEQAGTNLSLDDFGDCDCFEQPTAQERHGHWIEGGTPWISEVDECSECGYRIVYGMDFKFCPMCGADMRGAAE